MGMINLFMYLSLRRQAKPRRHWGRHLALQLKRLFQSHHIFQTRDSGFLYNILFPFIHITHLLIYNIITLININIDIYYPNPNTMGIFITQLPPTKHGEQHTPTCTTKRKYGPGNWQLLPLYIYSITHFSSGTI